MPPAAIAAVLLAEIATQAAGMPPSSAVRKPSPGLGYQAYKNYQSGKEPVAEPAPRAPAQLPAPPADSGFAAPEALSDDFALVLVRAMIAAAPRMAISTAPSAAASWTSCPFRAFPRMRRPSWKRNSSISDRSRRHHLRRGDGGGAVEIYTASRLAIEPDGRAERGYLDLLAGRLGLADALVDHIEATVSAAKIPV